MKKIINIILSICILFLPYTSVYAEDGLGSITLHCVSSEGVVLEGLTWNIYLVGERVDEETIELVGDFADYPVSFDDMSAVALRETAATLESYAVIDGITPLATGEIDTSGTLVFEDLDTGVYLLSAEVLVIDDVYYIPYAFFVEIDLNDPERIDFDVYPKYVMHDGSSGGGSSGGGEITGGEEEPPTESEVLLPETGGVGKIIFNVFGLSMMLYSSFILYKRR